MRMWSDWWERGVAGGNVEWQARAWSGRCERGVAGKSVEWQARVWSGWQECENDGGEVTRHTLGAARKALILSKIATFRVAKTTTLILAKCLIFSRLRVTLHVAGSKVAPARTCLFQSP